MTFYSWTFNVGTLWSYDPYMWIAGGNTWTTLGHCECCFSALPVRFRRGICANEMDNLICFTQLVEQVWTFSGTGNHTRICWHNKLVKRVLQSTGNWFNQSPSKESSTWRGDRGIKASAKTGHTVVNPSTLVWLWFPFFKSTVQQNLCTIKHVALNMEEPETFMKKSQNKSAGFGWEGRI